MTEKKADILEILENSHEGEGLCVFVCVFNTKPGISQITYVPYYVAVAMVTTFIF